MIALTIYTSTFVCEAIRSGINSVPLGQAEAARAIGLTFGRSMREVVLPQAFRATVPPLASVLIALLKNTSVAAAFGSAATVHRPDAVLHQHAADDRAPDLLHLRGRLPALSAVVRRLELEHRVEGGVAR